MKVTVTEKSISKNYPAPVIVRTIGPRQCLTGEGSWQVCLCPEKPRTKRHPSRDPGKILQQVPCDKISRNYSSGTNRAGPN